MNLRVAILILIAGLLSGCATLPPGSDYPKTPSVALAQPEQTSFGRQFADAAREHDGNSGFRMLAVGVDGFLTRVQMINTAERTLDLQYFIFRADETGQLLTEAALRAADRGVRVLEFTLSNARLDYRMHNKLMVVDNAIALIGGRNISDQYFQIDPQLQVGDDDVFAAGPIAKELSATFDEFWNSAIAIPVRALSKAKTSDAALAEYRKRLY